MPRRRWSAAVARLRRAGQVLLGRDPLRTSLARTQADVAELRRSLRSDVAPRAELDRLTARVAELEKDLDEQRSVSARVADLSDAVAHLLAVAAAGDAREVERAVREFADAL